MQIFLRISEHYLFKNPNLQRVPNRDHLQFDLDVDFQNSTELLFVIPKLLHPDNAFRVKSK